jgi:hypothetical protein
MDSTIATSCPMLQVMTGLSVPVVGHHSLKIPPENFHQEFRHNRQYCWWMSMAEFSCYNAAKQADHLQRLLGVALPSLLMEASTTIVYKHLRCMH